MRVQKTASVANVLQGDFRPISDICKVVKYVAFLLLKRFMHTEGVLMEIVSFEIRLK